MGDTARTGAAAATADTSAGFSDRLADHARAVEGVLDALLPAEGGMAGEAGLRAAMRYATLGGGKRLRAFLAIETAAMLGHAGIGALRCGAAVEALHAYSLVHDDLPCMDDDDLRRGRPTVHRAWDEATAVLAGDALQTFAFEILADPETHGDGAVRARLCLRLAQASGAAGMVGGQAIDLGAEGSDTPLDAAGVKRLQALKTGALIEVSAELGALVAGAPEADIERIRAYAAALGEAFQIADDLLDVTGSVEETGKAVGKDAGAGKATFVDILGIEGARGRAAALAREAADHLAPFGGGATALAEAANFVIARRS